MTDPLLFGVNTIFVENFAVPFPSGQAVKFRTYGKNLVGSGEYSPIVTAYADKVPLFMNQPTLISVDPKLIKIAWIDIPIAQNGGDAVTYYEVSCDQGTGEWVTLTTDTGLILY